MKRGFSLAEMAIALGLGAVLSLLLYQALTAAIGLTARASGRSKAQMEATVAWSSLVRDLQASSTSQLVLGDIPEPKPGQALLFPVLDKISASGTREWSKTQVLLHWDRSSKELRRRPMLEPVVDAATPLPGFIALLQRPERREDRILSNCLKSFRATLEPSSLIALALTFEISPGRELKLAGSVGARN